MITKQQFADEFAELAYRAGIRRRCGLDFPDYMSERNRRDARSFAEVDVESLTFYFAPQVLELPAAHRRGLIMHELGHVLTPGGSEADADRAAEAVFGVEIKYDCRWPGKGLQRANPADNCSTPLDVCCHTCHRRPGEPCKWGCDPGEYHTIRQRHFETQKERRTCPVCLSYLGHKEKANSRQTIEEIAAENYEAAVDAMSAQWPDYETLDEAIEAFGQNAVDTAREQGYSADEASSARHEVERLFRRQRANPSGYKVAYLDRARRAYRDNVYSLDDAKREMGYLKQRGMTAWVELEDGTFVPVAGAKRRPRFLEETREVSSGRYAPTGLDNVCVCSHSLGEHDAARAKVGGVMYQECQDPDCECICYKKARKKRNPVDLDHVPSIIHSEMAGAEARAVAAGANPETLDYLGAGAEGILFVDDGIAYKVGRKRSLKNEAIALAELDAAGAPVPWFQRYDAENDVIVREHIEGRPGGWGDDRVLRELYDQQIVPALRRIDFSCGEFKENSFIIAESGQPVMVDLGFLCPIGQRAVRELHAAMDELSPDDSYFDLQSNIRFALSDGDITPEQANEWADQLADVFGEDTVRDLRGAIRFIGGQ